MTFLLGRTEVRIHFCVLPFLAFCIVAGEALPLLYAAVSLTVHECAHLIAARNRGLSVERISVWPFGAVMTLSDPFGRGGDWITAAAGPAGSAVFAAVLSLSGTLFGARGWLDALIDVNLVIALLNLLPAYPLDGGRISKTLLCRVLPPNAVRVILLGFTALAAVSAFGVGLWLFLRGAPVWTLLALPPFLVASARKEWREPDAGTVTRVMERGEALRRGVPQKAVFLAVPESMRIGEAMAALSNNRFTVLMIRHRTGCVMLDESALLDAAVQFGTEKPLKTVFLRLTAGK